MNNHNNLTDKHKEFIEPNHWLGSINFNNVDIIECKSFNLFCFIRSLIENKIIQCNILINGYDKDRFYYNGKHYFNKLKLLSCNNRIYDYLRDSEGNYLFWCEDKYDLWNDNKFVLMAYIHFGIKEVNEEFNKEDLILTYIKDNE